MRMVEACETWKISSGERGHARMVDGVCRRLRHAATGGARDRLPEERKQLVTGASPTGHGTRSAYAMTTGVDAPVRGATSLPVGAQNGQWKSSSFGTGASPGARAAGSE